MNYISYDEYKETYKEIEEIYTSPEGNKVIKVEHKTTNACFAIKMINNINGEYSGVFFNREIDALKKLNNISDIVTLYEAFIIKDKNIGCIVLEFIDGINLQQIQLSKELRNNDKYEIILNIVKAVDNAHKLNVIHRDIKPTNIMILDENKVKIIDFGISKIKDQIRTEYSPTVRCFGSSGYQSPEAKEKKENIDERSDIYSLGAVMYYLFSNEEPKEDAQEFYRQVSENKDISVEIQDLILKMILINPNSRMEIDKIIKGIEKIYDIEAKNSNLYTIHIEKQIIDIMIRRNIVLRTDIKKILNQQLPENFYETYAFFEKDKKEYIFIGESIEVKCKYDSYNQFFLVTEINNLKPPTREFLKTKYLKISGDFLFDINTDKLLEKISNNKELSIKLINYSEEKSKEESDDRIFAEVFSIWLDGLKQELDNIKKSAIRFSYDDVKVEDDDIIFKLNEKFIYSIDDLKDIFDENTEFIFEDNNKIRRIGRLIRIEENEDDINVVIERKRNKVALPKDKIIIEDYRKKSSAVKKQIRAIKNLKDDKNNQLRRILTGISKPDNFMKNINIDYYNQDLDTFQRKAVKKAICSSSITLIQGPPGTGKTSVITEIIRQILKEERGTINKILLVSQANKAVDNVLSKIKDDITNKIVRIGEESKIEKEIYDKYSIDKCIPIWINQVKEKSIKFIDEYLSNKKIYYSDMLKYIDYIDKRIDNKKTNNKFISDFEEKHKDKDFEKVIYLFRIHYEWLKNINKQNDMEVNYIKNCDIVAGTCIGFKSNPIISDSLFEYVIIDEAAKASTPELLVSLMQCSKKIIMVGDQNQLPPQLSIEMEEIFRSDELQQDKSFFTTLFESLDSNNKQTLIKQYRMNPVIGTMVSKLFYNNDILNGTKEEKENHNLDRFEGKNIVWISTDKIENNYEKINETKSYENFSEACTIKEELMQLDKEEEIKKYSIGIITPYSGQKKLLKKELRKIRFNKIDINNIEVNSVDAFQGSEKDIIIYSIVRNNLKGEMGFTKSKERLNVAFSRAKKLIIMVGSSNFIQNVVKEDNKYLDVIKYINTNKEKCEIRYTNIRR